MHAPRFCAPALLIACVLYAGCTAPALSVPVIREVLPATGLDDRAVRITVSGEGFNVAASTDFQSSADSEIDPRFQLLLGEVRLDDVVWVDATKLEATVPAGLLPGSYAATLIDPQGRVANMPNAYEVVAVEEANAKVASFDIDPPGAQLVGRPFVVRVVAVDSQGARVEGFNGTVTLTDDSGAIAPAELGSFLAGQWSGPVELRAPKAGNVLRVTDDRGRAGQSAPFDVSLPPATSLLLAGLPPQLTAGDCQPVSVQLLDDHGVNTVGAALAVTLSVDPAGALSFFSDSGCASEVTGVSLTGSTPFYVKGVLPLEVDVVASAAGLASARQRTHVLTGAPADVVFLTPPQTVAANSCSALNQLGLVDSQGNPITVSAPSVLSLSVTPATGLLLFSNAGCSSATATTTIATGGDRAGFYFRATTAGTYAVTAQLQTLTATQDQLVLPASTSGTRSPPQARLTGSSGVLVNAALTADASTSSDSQTPHNALQFSFDFTNSAVAPGTTPWTAWSTTKTATSTFSTTGSKTVRVAVRDADGDISVDEIFVRVVPVGGTCVVTSSAPDDGATNCGAGTGPDGVLSFAEAVRLVNARSGSFEIILTPPLQISGSHTLSRSGYLLGAPGVVFNDATLTFDGTAAVRAGFIELTGPLAKLAVLGAAELILEDSDLHDFEGVDVTGRRFDVLRSRIANCTDLSCISVSNSAQFLSLEHCESKGLPGKRLLSVTDSGAPNSGLRVRITSSVITRFGTAIVLAGGNTQGTELFNNTFDSNITALQILSGNKINVRNNIFSRHSADAVTGCANGQLQTHDNHLFFQNLDDGCFAADPGSLFVNPQFVDVMAWDFTLRQSSPAVDTGGNVGADLNGGAAGSFSGAAPDRGGVESW